MRQQIGVLEEEKNGLKNEIKQLKNELTESTKTPKTDPENEMELAELKKEAERVNDQAMEAKKLLTGKMKDEIEQLKKY